MGLRCLCRMWGGRGCTLLRPARCTYQKSLCQLWQKSHCQLWLRLVKRGPLYKVGGQGKHVRTRLSASARWSQPYALHPTPYILDPRSYTLLPCPALWTWSRFHGSVSGRKVQG